MRIMGCVKAASVCVSGLFLINLDPLNQPGGINSNAALALGFILDCRTASSIFYLLMLARARNCKSVFDVCCHVCVFGVGS